MVHGPEQTEHGLTGVDHLASSAKPQKTLSLVRKVDTLSAWEREIGPHERMVLTLEHASRLPWGAGDFLKHIVGVPQRLRLRGIWGWAAEVVSRPVASTLRP